MTIGKEHELHYKNMNTKIIYSDGQQIHQHQQDEQSALISTPTNPSTPTRRTISSHLNSLNTKIIYSDGQQIHQHQQDEQSALISTR